MSHYASSLCTFLSVNCFFWPINRNAGQAIPPLFWPVNCIKIGGHVALLSDLTVNCLYCDQHNEGKKTTISHFQNANFIQQTKTLNFVYFSSNIQQIITTTP